MSDRLSVRVEFKKAIWFCPKCAKEDIEDMSPGGGNKYEHNCSVCNEWFNTFKEYNGVLQYPYLDYAKVEQKVIDEEKTKRVDAWIVEIKNPPIPKEPTKEDLEQQKLAAEQEIEYKTKQVAELAEKISAMTADAVDDPVKPVDAPVGDTKP
jgi:hypothetical protein